MACMVKESVDDGLRANGDGQDHARSITYVIT
jgi:hypothetical protein